MNFVTRGRCTDVKVSVQSVSSSRAYCRYLALQTQPALTLTAYIHMPPLNTFELFSQEHMDDHTRALTAEVDNLRTLLTLSGAGSAGTPSLLQLTCVSSFRVL